MIPEHETPAAANPSANPPCGKSGGQTDSYFDHFNQAPAGFCTLDEQGRILEANHALTTLLGASAAALRHETLASFIFREDQPIYDRFRQALFASGVSQAVELRLETKTGAVLWAHLAATLGADSAGAPMGRIVLCDRTPFRQTEQSLRQLYVVLAQVNQAIVHYRDRNELFRAVCRIAIQFGHFRMAWIGLVEEPTGQLKPVAHAGHEEGYLGAIHVNVNPGSAFSQGPSGQAILRNQVVASGDFETSPQISPWRNEALKRGYRASVAVPFCLQGKPVGSLNLYLGAPNAFSAEELDLLKRIGATLSFALDYLDVGRNHQRAEAALRESEAQNRAFIHAIPDLVFMNKRDGEYLSVHAPNPGLLAAPLENVLHRKIDELLPKPVADRCLQAIAAALDARTLQKLTYVLPIDGAPRRFEARVVPCTPDTALTVVRDITELKPVGKAARKPQPRRPKK